jgi:hypothetical protein
VEIVLSIALSTLVLLAASVFVFASFNLLTQTQNDPGLEHHKLGVVGYLEYAFYQAPPASNTTTTTGSGGIAGGGFTAGLGGTGNSTANAAAPTSPLSSGLTGAATTSASQTNHVSWGFPPNVPTMDDPYLSFRVDDDDPLLVWQGGPRPPATAWLFFKEGEGLSIVWQTDQQKLTDASAVQRTILSPLVTKMAFVYYDSTTSSWTESTTPIKDPTGNQLLPNFIRLTFRINGKDEPISVNIPPGTTNMPIY